MTVFVSDLHLGNPGCKAERLIEFLSRCPQDTLYLIGDIVDDLGARWPRSHVEVVRLMLSFQQLVYVPGNHDHYFRRIAGLSGRISVDETALYQAQNGRRYLVTHGDAQDPSVGLCVGPRWFRAAAANLAGKLHSRLLLDAVERRIVETAARQNVDGVICGHTHRPAQIAIGSFEYLNCGDWIRHCTAIVDDGALRLVTQGSRKREP